MHFKTHGSEEENFQDVKDEKGFLNLDEKKGRKTRQD
jgi:hypothetical protein